MPQSDFTGDTIKSLESLVESSGDGVDGDTQQSEDATVALQRANKEQADKASSWFDSNSPDSKWISDHFIESQQRRAGVLGPFEKE